MSEQHLNSQAQRPAPDHPDPAATPSWMAAALGQTDMLGPALSDGDFDDEDGSFAAAAIKGLDSLRGEIATMCRDMRAHATYTRDINDSLVQTFMDIANGITHIANGIQRQNTIQLQLSSLDNEIRSTENQVFQLNANLRQARFDLAITDVNDEKNSRLVTALQNKIKRTEASISDLQATLSTNRLRKDSVFMMLHDAAASPAPLSSLPNRH